jgi:CubicO group peptidase (beta-lactamase class C family)
VTEIRLRSRGLAALGIAVVLAGCTSTGPTAARSGTSSSSTAAHRVDTPQVRRLVDAFFENDTTDAFRNRQALVISVDGDVVLEQYWQSTAATSGSIESAGKTILSTLIGVALDEGELRSLDQTLVELLPDYSDVMIPSVAAVTLRQLLTMTSGLPADDEFYPAVFSAEPQDWVRAILTAGLTGRPGTFQYSSAGSHLLSAILSEATRRSALDYAREKLFDPLGISTRPATEVPVTPESLDDYERADFAWPTDPQGRYIGGGGQKLTARDMARFGQLWLQEGRWEGRQLVSSEWIEAAETDRVPVGASGEDYGYQVWLATADGHDAVLARGFAGQLIEIVPDLGLVVAVLSRHDLDPRIPAEPGTADREYMSLATLIAPTIR